MGKDQLLGQLLELIKDVPFFKSFTKEEKYSLASSDCEVVRYLSHEDIINEGDSDHVLYILLKGEVGVTKNLPSLDPKKKTRKVVVAKLSVGSVFGEIALISNRSRTSGVHAIGEVIALKMDGDVLEKMAPPFRSKIQAQLIEILVKRLDDMNDKMSDMVR